MRNRSLLVVLLCAVSAVTITRNAGAQTAYPSKPVRMIVPFPAGGTTDMIAREVGQLLSRSLGQPVIMDNRPGANGAIGAALVAQAPPDGYTLFMASAAILTINPHLRRDLPHDPQRDFAPVSLVAATANILVVHPLLPIRSVNDLLALAKARPNAITFGSSGIGSVGHLALEQFRTLGGVRMLHVPYRGAVPAEIDLLAGHIAVMTSGIVSVLPHVTNGRVRALAVTSPERTSLLPDLPAMSEFLPGFNAGAWFGVLTPAGVAPSVIERLHRDVVVALNDRNLRKQFSSSGAEVIGSTPSEFLRHIQAESTRYAKLIRDAGIRSEK